MNGLKELKGLRAKKGFFGAPGYKSGLSAFSVYAAIAALALSSETENNNNNNKSYAPAPMEIIQEARISWEISVQEEKISVSLDPSIIFKPSRAALAPEGEAQAKKLAALAAELQPESAIVKAAVAGGHDNPQFPDPRHLAAARAAELAAALSREGLEARYMGSEQNGEGWALELFMGE
jgi:flagellar motor protein MotB